MQKITSFYAITLSLFSCTSYAIPVLTQPAISASAFANNRQLRFTPPPLPSSGTPVGRRRGAAGRGNCTLKLPLTALVPTFEQTLGEGKITYVWARTLAERPAFWFYVPDSRPSLNSVEFVLQDEQDNDVYRTRVNLPEKPGVVSVRLPATATPLKINQRYHWFLKTEGEDNCAPQQGNLVKDSVEGWVQRVTPNPTLIDQLKVATPQQRIELYAKNGFWYEAITSLAELRLLKPEDAILKADWDQLLQSVGLSYIASQPLVRCCTTEN